MPDPKYRQYFLQVPGSGYARRATSLAEGRIERIGQPGGDCPDYPSAIRKCIAAISGPGKHLQV
jgi:hypothetical protein